MEEISITENGEVDVQIAPIGDFNGSDVEGRPVPETLTQDGLDELANKLNARGEDVLVDTDHCSCRAGLDRNTQAVGWISKFWTNVKGLFGKLKLTKSGRELVENREYRFLSPTFSLDQNGRPVELHSVALTNTPAFQGSITPIINHAAKMEDTEPIASEEHQTTKELITMEITKDELVDLIKATVKAMDKTEEKVEEVEETKEEVKEEKVDNACSEEKTNEVKNEQTTAEETQTETKEKAENACSEDKEEAVNTQTETETKEEVKEDKEEDEVIKIEAVNSAPIPKAPQEAEWKFLHGKAFWDALRKHPEWLERN